ncbi:MAG TPA: hybrid sensor histidine kinase/response regulator [Steroidobacteraceae bacterium]|nr:hybrid sensor histidine kinase/response regulator [Steroidobacteraceae bacterium]
MRSARAAAFDDPSSEPADPPARARLIAAQLVSSQYRNLPAALLVNAVISVLLCLALRGAVSDPRLGIWLAAVYLTIAGRYGLWRAFTHSETAAANLMAHPRAHPRAWGRRATVGSAINGLVWGIGGLTLYAPQSAASQFLLLIAEFGMGAGSAYASQPSLESFLAYLYPSVLLSAVPFFAAGDSVHVTLGIMLLVFVAAATHFGGRISGAIASSIELRFENVQLIRELRNQRDAAERAKDAAEEANIAKSRFLAAASHDLRQPLHALGFFIYALREQPLAPESREILGNIRRSVDAMEGLFNALLEVSRLDAGIVHPCLSTVALAPILNRVVREYEPLAAEKGLSLSMSRTTAVARTDPQLLERILRHLVTNAIRYTDDGGILVGCRRGPGVWALQVWDTGRGIAANQQREIFQEFRQLDNPERDRRKGLGLGLAIVERLGKLLEHPIEVRSEVGRGSMFSVTIPRGKPQDCVPEEEPGEIAPDLDVANSLILIVDDESAVRESMAALLSRWRCEVVVAGSGPEMVEKLVNVRRQPDLIVSDFSLRDNETGVQVVERLREEFNAPVPALLITGDTAPQRLREAQASGLHILHKPLNPSRLRALIASVRREGSAGRAAAR